MSNEKRRMVRYVKPLTSDEIQELTFKSSSLSDRRWASDSRIDSPSTLPPIFSGTNGPADTVSKVSRPPTPSLRRSAEFSPGLIRKGQSLPFQSSPPRRTRSLDMRSNLEALSYHEHCLYNQSVNELPATPRLRIRSLPSSPSIPRRRTLSPPRRKISTHDDSSDAEGSKAEWILNWIQDVAEHKCDLSGEDEVFLEPMSEANARTGRSLSVVDENQT